MIQSITMCFEGWDEERRILSLSYATKEKAIVAGLTLIKSSLKFENIPQKIPKMKYNIKSAPRKTKKFKQKKIL